MLELTAADIADLMHKHRHELLRFLSQRISCTDTAQDIFQETFIRYAGYGGKDSVENPRAFIFRIAANLATDYLRSRSRHAGPDLEAAANDEAEVDVQSSLSAERTVMSQQQLEQLITALDDLSPKCREVFILLKLKHYSYAEVEQRLGISQTMIFKYLTQAMRHCRAKVGDLN
ncbi:RNA polymerase sigma factor [Methylomonas fluvii]|uniref:Sigma-70 family RNA polymerase sigma factor n=1 Tax=Methylomonas fluvii TaxID=1854564 RepID=A0ABR9D9K7_9GAMM|nr:sigma-70 family RNA polymerase sigma factor [Methylomonas fluvii]MBD9359791.1 sigma-70 family RNA polymerase sigma factor [Methylomonas fluvii]